MKRSNPGKAAFAAVLLASGGVAMAAGAADVVKARQANFKTMGRAMKAMFDELKQPAPRLEVFRANARPLADAAGRVGRGFPLGSGPAAGVKTHALPVIWQKNQEFRKDADNLVHATSALRRAAEGGNLDAVKAALPAVGKACKACHETFKARED